MLQSVLKNIFAKGLTVGDNLWYYVDVVRSYKEDHQMEYTGKYRKMFSSELGENVSILEYKSADNFPYCDCDRCGKPIRRRMFVVQSEVTDIELMYLGAECVKHLR